MNLSDAQILAYVDGELDADGRAEVEAAAARDPAVAAALARHQSLKRQVADAYAGVLAEPPPPRLEALIHAAGPAPVSAKVIDLAARRAKQRPPRPAGLLQGLALAAAGVAAVGLFVTVGLSRPAALYAAQGGALVAQAGLDQALTHQLAADPGAARKPIRVGLSFRARDGDYCRTFSALQGASASGVACREGPAWAIRAVVIGPPRAADTGDYRTAASALPEAVTAAVNDLIVGPPLDAEAEAKARANGWR